MAKKLYVNTENTEVTYKPPCARRADLLSLAAMYETNYRLRLWKLEKLKMEIEWKKILNMPR